MNVYNTPMGVLWTYYWEYRIIFAMFLSIFSITTNFSEHFVYKLENEEYKLNKFSFYHFTDSDRC